MKHRVVEILAITPASLKDVREAATELYLNEGGKLLLVVNIAMEQQASQKHYVLELADLMAFLRHQDKVTVDALGMQVMDSVGLLLFTASGTKACLPDCLFAIPRESQFHGPAFQRLWHPVVAGKKFPHEIPTIKSLHFDAQKAQEWQLVDMISENYRAFVKSLNSSF